MTFEEYAKLTDLISRIVDVIDEQNSVVAGIIIHLSAKGLYSLKPAEKRMLLKISLMGPKK